MYLLVWVQHPGNCHSVAESSLNTRTHLLAHSYTHTHRHIFCTPQTLHFFQSYNQSPQGAGLHGSGRFSVEREKHAFFYILPVCTFFTGLWVIFFRHDPSSGLIYILIESPKACPKIMKRMVCLPSRPMQVSWPSPNMGVWFQDVIKTHDQLQSWLDRDRPRQYWLTGFFNPQGFLTAVRQEVCLCNTGLAMVRFRAKVRVWTRLRVLGAS